MSPIRKSSFIPLTKRLVNATNCIVQDVDEADRAQNPDPRSLCNALQDWLDNLVRSGFVLEERQQRGSIEAYTTALGERPWVKSWFLMDSPTQKFSVVLETSEAPFESN